MTDPQPPYNPQNAQGGQPPAQPPYPQQHPQYPNQQAPQPQYGQPQPPYPVPPGGYPNQPPGVAYPVKTGPSKVLGIVKLVFGGLFLLGMFGAIASEAYDGIGVAIGLGIPFGLGCWLATSGGANVIGKKLGKYGLGTLAAGILFCAVVGPIISEAAHVSAEQSTWDELTAYSPDQQWGYMWEYDYMWEIPEQFQRPEAQGEYMHAQVQDAIRDNNLIELRRLTSVLASDHKGDKNFDKARNAAEGLFKKRYDEVLSKLAKPLAKVDPNDPNRPEFLADDELRIAFKIILEDLARAATPNVYLAFTNSSELKAPAGHEASYEAFKSNPMVKKSFPDGNVPVISPGDAFSSRFDAARRGSFTKVAEDAFRRMFDANLLTLRPLPDGEDRDGKIVLEVNSKIIRGANYFNYYETDASNVNVSKGLLFGISVEWRFTLFDRDGDQLYDKATVSEPGNDLRINTQPSDPNWAVYSILMDSAYYNYSREQVGSFGLIPPAEKTLFSYSNYGVAE
ncbi:MAG: hypothetical protein ACYTDT_07075 [Planctomycetota bacterium]|jgi:hypothetical protein